MSHVAFFTYDAFMSAVIDEAFIVPFTSRLPVKTRPPVILTHPAVRLSITWPRANVIIWPIVRLVESEMSESVIVPSAILPVVTEPSTTSDVFISPKGE